MALTKLKVCISCDEDNLEMFGKEKGGKFGLRSKCKKCRSLERKEYYRKNKDKEYAYRKKYCLENPEKIKVSRKIQNKKESTKESKRIWASNNKDKIRLKNKIYSANNKDKIRKRNKDRLNRNPGLANKYTANYRASKKNAAPKWLTDSDKWLIAEYYRISSELSRITTVKYEVDHIIPLNGKFVSGFHCPANLQIIKMSDNRIKSNKVA